MRVRLFAALREIAGGSEIDVDADTVAGVLDELAARYGDRFEAIAAAGSVVVDGERASAERLLTGTEDVAVLPPFSGG
ncbi:MAG: MoaD/ThiS family protein [Actinomycetota bacterium]